MKKTIRHRYRNAVRFKQQQGTNTWLVLGGTSAWTSPLEPPEASNSTSEVAQKIVAVKASVKWIIEDPEDGTIEFKDANNVTRKFREITDANNVVLEGATMALLEAEVLGSSIGVPFFRIAGFYTGLIPDEDFQEATILTPSQVSNWGVLETVKNLVARTVAPEVIYRFRSIVQF